MVGCERMVRLCGRREAMGFLRVARLCVGFVCASRAFVEVYGCWSWGVERRRPKKSGVQGKSFVRVRSDDDQEKTTKLLPLSLKCLPSHVKIE